MGHKKRKVWLWLVIERTRRRIVGRTLGRRFEAPMRRLWQALPAHCRHHCWFFTDQGKAYAKVLLRWQPRPGPKGEGRTNAAGAINCPLRRHCGVPGRKSCSFSKSLAVHTARIELIIANYNQRILSD